ncbi:hypothetical protein ACFL5V_07020 [Fibrobacterota bacterium]
MKYSVYIKKAGKTHTGQIKPKKTWQRPGALIGLMIYAVLACHVQGGAPKVFEKYKSAVWSDTGSGFLMIFNSHMGTFRAKTRPFYSAYNCEIRLFEKQDLKSFKVLKSLPGCLSCGEVFFMESRNLIIYSFSPGNMQSPTCLEDSSRYGVISLDGSMLHEFRADRVIPSRLDKRIAVIREAKGKLRKNRGSHLNLWIISIDSLSTLETSKPIRVKLRGISLSSTFYWTKTDNFAVKIPDTDFAHVYYPDKGIFQRDKYACVSSITAGGPVNRKRQRIVYDNFSRKLRVSGIPDKHCIQ